MYNLNKNLIYEFDLRNTFQFILVHYFPLENANKHGFFEILSPQSILLVSSFPRMKSGNSIPLCDKCCWREYFFSNHVEYCESAWR